MRFVAPALLHADSLLQFEKEDALEFRTLPCRTCHLYSIGPWIWGVCQLKKTKQNCSTLGCVHLIKVYHHFKRSVIWHYSFSFCLIFFSLVHIYKWFYSLFTKIQHFRNLKSCISIFRLHYCHRPILFIELQHIRQQFAENFLTHNCLWASGAYNLISRTCTEREASV